jgi:hypothetical protein
VSDSPQATEIIDLGELVTTLLAERDEHDDEEWLRKQLAELDESRRVQLEPLLDDALDEFDLPEEMDVVVTRTGDVLNESYDADWPSDFDGWSGRSRPERSEDEEGFLRRFTWRFGGKVRTWELEVPGPLFKYYTNRHRTRSFGVYISDPFDEPFISSLANRIREFGSDVGLNENERINAAVRFVQSLEYTPDDVTTGQIEYPKYPIETLVHDGGDCEDTSILLGAILRELGCDVAPIVLPNHQHMILGVSPTTNIDGSHFEHEGTKYYTVEATGHGWDIGELPRQYSGASGEVYPVGGDPILVHDWTAQPRSDGKLDLMINLANFGDVCAESLAVQLEFEDESGSIVGRTQVTRDQTILPSQSETFRAQISLPDDTLLRGKCLLTIGHRVHDASTSDWQKGHGEK